MNSIQLLGLIPLVPLLAVPAILATAHRPNVREVVSVLAGLVLFGLAVGAGLSGIGAACHLKEALPDMDFVILEGRERMGGTWDLFRYPGIRSDSDMHTLGYRFKPWEDAKAIADGPAILQYIRETAAEHDIENRIRYQHNLTRAEWSGNDCA